MLGYNSLSETFAVTKPSNLLTASGIEEISFPIVW